MANQVVEGYFLLNKNTLRGYTPSDLGSLKVELEKLQRELRGLTPAQDDALAQQARNRKMSRLSTALQIVGVQMTSRH